MYYPLLNSVEIADKVKVIIDSITNLQCELVELYQDLRLPVDIGNIEQLGKFFTEDTSRPDEAEIEDPGTLEIVARLQRMERRHARQIDNLSAIMLKIVELAGLDKPQQKKP